MTVLALGATSAEAAQWGGCVAYVRQQTGISIFANAWGWWDGAAGRFARGQVPNPGSILVFRRSGTMPLGHVSMVSAVLDSRTILVDHHWGRAGIIHGNRVIDTSPNNDWSSVRVWHHPSDTAGIYNYPTYGFVYPDRGPGEVTAVAAAAPMSAPVQVGRQVWNHRASPSEIPSPGAAAAPQLSLGPAPATAAMAAPVVAAAPLPAAPAVTRITAARAPRPRQAPAARVHAGVPSARPASPAHGAVAAAPRPAHSPVSSATVAAAHQAHPAAGVAVAQSAPRPGHHPAARSANALAAPQVAALPRLRPGRHPARALATSQPQLADTEAGSPAAVAPVSAIEP